MSDPRLKAARLSVDSRQVLIPVATFFGVLLLASAAMLAIRIYLVEPEQVAAACVAGSGGWRCAIRNWAVAGFLNNYYGIAAVVFGIFATVMRSRLVALLAILAGVAGSVLYTFELSGIGVLLGALVWVRRAPPKSVAHAQAD